MERRGTPQNATASVWEPMGFPEQLAGMVLLLFALLIYVSSDDHSRQLPVLLLPAILVLALFSYRRPVGSMPTLEQQTGVPVVSPPVERVEVCLPPTQEVATASAAQPRRLWKDAVAEIGNRHVCKYKLGLGPLVFGPEADVMPILDGCLSAKSLYDVTTRSREIILLGRDQYALLRGPCTQKTFVRYVIKAHDAMRLAKGLPKLKISYDIFCNTLTGKYSVLKGCLDEPMPNEDCLQLGRVVI
jgi:hypothetical protein